MHCANLPNRGCPVLNGRMNPERPVADAVTAVLIHNGEVFMTRRAIEMTAFPGYTAFPGGKVEPGDQGGRFEGGAFADHPPKLIRALARELDEELGFNFIDAYRRRQIRGIHNLGVAVTPAFAPLRFRTWFFRVDLAERPDFVLDKREASEGQWRPAAELIKDYQRGHMLMVPPTVEVLRKLQRVPDARTVPKLNFSFDPDTEIPMLEPLGGLRVLLVRSNTLPPADRTNCFHFGDAGSPRVLVDPSPKDETEYARLRDATESLAVDRILLTHHHRDHCERADQLARELKVPVLMSADTKDRLSIRQGGRFLHGLNVELVKQDDVVTHWHGEPVSVIEVPGHDRGQIALMPESRAWCIVGDLIQGIGTVVIAPPEGDMGQYFRSMRRVINLNPAVILPSHGPALGSVYRLQTALEHRQQREQAIFQAWMDGDDEEAMLTRIYQDLDPRLKPLALINIRSHMKKLREEGRVDA